MLQENMSDEDEESIIKRRFKGGIPFVHNVENMCRHRSDFWSSLSSLFLRGVLLDSTGQLVGEWRIRG